MEDKHFDKVFLFVCSVCFGVWVFDMTIILVPLSTVGQKYADNLVGALNTGALMACIGYLLGGNPANKKADTVVSGDNTNVTTSK